MTYLFLSQFLCFSFPKSLHSIQDHQSRLLPQFISKLTQSFLPIQLNVKKHLRERKNNNKKTKHTWSHSLTRDSPFSSPRRPSIPRTPRARPYTGINTLLYCLTYTSILWNATHLAVWTDGNKILDAYYGSLPLCKVHCKLVEFDSGAPFIFLPIYVRYKVFFAPST